MCFFHTQKIFDGNVKFRMRDKCPNFNPSTKPQYPNPYLALRGGGSSLNSGAVFLVSTRRAAGAFPRMLKEQNQTLRTEILRQKAKDEAKALLTNAVEHQGRGLPWSWGHPGHWVGGRPAAALGRVRSHFPALY